MDSIEQYYLSLYGEPERKAKFVSPEGVTIEIFKWSEEQTDEGVAMYCTSGASSVLGDQKTSCEFFIGIAPAVDGIAPALAEVALHGAGSVHVPNSGDSITLAYDLWSGTKARSFLFTDGEEIIPAVSVDQKKIIFIQLVPLYDSELEFKRSRSEVALWQKFEELMVPYWDSAREKAF